MNSMKRQMKGYWKKNSPVQKVPNMLLEISGEITPERMKGNKNGLEWVNLTQMTIISTTAGRNPLEEME